MKKDENINRERKDKLPFESPQNEESRRLAQNEKADAVTEKDGKKDEGKLRGGNQSANRVSKWDK